MNFLNIFEVIILSSLIGSVIVLIILITKGLFKNKLNPTFHYYIWLILLIKLIIPIGPQTPLNISNIYENLQVQSTANENTQINSPKQLETSDLGDSISTSSPLPSNKSVIMKVMNIPLKNQISIEKAFCFIWLFGILLLMCIVAFGHRKLRKIVRASIKNISSTHKEIFYKCMKTMNIKTEVELSYSSKVSSPSLCGFIKPMILIPVRVADNVCDEEFKYIIIHELTHLKNKDILINWVITLLSMTYWFNPILLYGFHKIRQDCEFSCDGKAISYLDKGKNLQYGNAIIRVLELGGNSNRLMGTTSMVMNSSEIKRRIIMISKYKKVNIKNVLLGAVIVVIIGSLGIALNTSKSQAEKPAKVAEEFVRTIYTVDAKKVAVFNTPLTPSNIIGEGVTKGITGPSEEQNKIMRSLDKNIQPLMTKEGYENTVRTQFNTLSTRICAMGNYTAQIIDFTLGENVYSKDDDKVRYRYEVKLKFISTDGKSDQSDSATGAVDLLKENGQWKVCLYDINQFPKLSK
ncbi:M56 family metallopeptidase [Clostridium estertheticum]|uniref:M56 family metallopeptidase n=1 Tax=Clostridium estertheticum TaxID=238834 RepID=UPI0013E997A3|nr:M56 family metallopeptidase [Clostridium estertheticum]MBZ9689577.1 M56 family metallopeptidase [Clostridium estertheticum]